MLATRPTVLLLAVCGLIVLGGCPRVPFGFEAREDYTLAVDFAGIETVRVQWRNGGITCRVDTTATQARVVGSKITNGPTQTEADVALLDIDIALAPDPTDPSTLLLTFTAPTDVATSYAATADIALPAGVTLDIESANGDIEISDNRGETRVRLNNGSIEITEQTGDVDARTDNGNVEITCEEGDVTADSDNGNVTIDATDGRVIASTDNGQVTVDARPDADDSITATASAGDVSIRVPADFIATFVLRTNFGNVTLVNNLTDFDGATITTRTAGRAEGTLNGGVGGGEINGTSDVGEVSLGVLP